MESELMDWEGMLAQTVRVGAVGLSVDALLRCMVERATPAGLDEDELHRVRETFVRAGLGALQREVEPNRWIQLGLWPGQGPRAELYAQLAALARTLLDEGTLDDFFFMHKEPGLRLRFAVAHGDRATTLERIQAALAPGLASGSIAALRPGIYEPETQLFGGPASMSHVHRLFTHDALTWLDVHAIAGDDPGLRGSAWVVSFAILRVMFIALGIVDWEDLDVWDRVRSRTGRQLPDEALAEASFGPVADQIRAAWLDPSALVSTLPPRLGQLTSAATEAIAGQAQRWREQYFASEHACLGPRAGAALFVLFHWNRAGIPWMRQALLAESLCRRPTV